MVNGTQIKFGKRYEDDLRFIFDQWPKLHFGLDALSKILNGIYWLHFYLKYLLEISCWNIIIWYILKVQEDFIEEESTFIIPEVAQERCLCRSDAQGKIGD